jgi:DNA (cytosine-5)-methyltransferase 1
LRLKPSLPFSEIPARLDDGIVFLREVAHILALVHSTPNLGNKHDSVDELVYIILSRKTPEKAYQEGFRRLKERFATWDELLAAPQTQVKKLIFSAGLPGKKTLSLYGALGKLKATFGRCTLEPARDWSDEKLESFLCSLPEIHRKSAFCIMMYAFGRQVGSTIPAYRTTASLWTTFARFPPRFFAGWVAGKRRMSRPKDSTWRVFLRAD